MIADPVHMLYRRQASESSINAAKSLNTVQLKQLVMDAVTDSAEAGITAKEIVKNFPTLPYSSITARPAALEREGRIFYLGDRRDGSRIIRHTKFFRQDEHQ